MNHDEIERNEESEERPLDATADLPRSIKPARDLWPGIEGQVRTEARPGKAVAGRFDGWRRPLLAAAAVAIVFLAGYGIGQMGNPGGPAGDGGAPVAIGRSPEGDAPVDPWNSLQLAASADTDSVLAILARRQDDLDPATVETLKRNLQIIDEAVSEIRTALDHDPENQKLQRMLYAEERRRGSVLNRAADLLKVS